MHIKNAGDAALQIVFGAGLDPAVNEAVLRFAAALRSHAVPGVLSVISGYTTVLVEYDPDALRPVPLRRMLSGIEPEATALSARQVEVPVCYEGDLAPDLEEVAGRVGLSREAVVALHSGSPYRIYATGFAPGFPFGAPLAPVLVLPRRDSPRDAVPAGSVAIAGRQTGIYPVSTPGGWHLIGRTPIPLFRPDADDPVLLHPGDTVRFVPISRTAFDRCAQDAET